MLVNLDIDLTTLPKDKISTGKNGHKYIKLTAATMRQPDQWGNDMTVFVAQTREERGRMDRMYVGKGKIFDNPTQPRPAQPQQISDFPDDLGF